MNILLVTATPFEVASLIDTFPEAKINEQGLFCYTLNSCEITLLITGVGMVATAFALGKYLRRTYDFALNVGIAGSFNYQLNIGDVINVHEDCFAELGAEDDNSFLTIDELGFGSNIVSNKVNFTFNTALEKLPKANGITVNKVHGNEYSIRETVTRFNPTIESMEGAAFLFGCKKNNVNCAQVRAISNYVEKRNKATWNIPLAIQNLNKTASAILLDFK